MWRLVSDGIEEMGKDSERKIEGKGVSKKWKCVQERFGVWEYLEEKHHIRLVLNRLWKNNTLGSLCLPRTLQE